LIRNRKIVEDHKKCEICKKLDNKTMFFSFPITSKLILELKNYGYEDCIYFDEKKLLQRFLHYNVESNKKFIHQIS